VKSVLSDEQIMQLEQSDDPASRDMARQLRERAEHRKRILTEVRAAGDWDQLLSLHGSEERAAVLVEALAHADGPETRADLFREWFNMCDALAPQREQLRAYLEETPFFTDEEGAKAVPDFPVVVYRGAWHDDDAEHALSWTTDRSFAEKFARGLVGMRARYVLGIYRADATPTIFRAVAIEAYGFLNGRGEHEVIAKTLRAVEPISELVSADG
jgi:hypothetical protein